MKTFAMTFKEERIKAKTSQGKIAKFMGWTSPQFVSNWERGISYPSPEALETIANAFEMNHAKLSSLILKEKMRDLKEKWGPKDGSKES